MMAGSLDNRSDQRLLVIIDDNKPIWTPASETPKTDQNPPAFDFKTIGEDFHKLLIATGYSLERQWPASYARVASAQMVLLQFVRLAITNYKTIAFICSDISDGANRDPLLALSTPPLNRTNLEIIGSVLYLLEDLPRHSDLFYRAAWRDEDEMLAKYRDRYSGRPRWDAYIDIRSKGQAKLEAALGITEAEKRDLNQILYWPKLGKILKRLRKEHPNSTAIPYLQFLDDWLYRELSTLSHVEPRGLGQLGLHFLGMEDLKAISGEDRDDIRERLDQKLQELRTTQVWIALTLILSLVSEIDFHFDYGRKQYLIYFWILIIAHSEISQEVYKERYEGLLTC